MDTKLQTILTLKRPTFNRQGIYVQDQWAEVIRALLPISTNGILDQHGNLMAYVFQQGPPEMATLFSCHLDTVHRTLGTQKLIQVGNLVKTIDGECLGADDGAGVWLLLSMIENRIPGCYIFHFAEEVGCVGSQWMARNHEDWLRQFKTVISFDRPYCTDVVTHLCGELACIEHFALDLADDINTYLPEEYVLDLSSNGGMTDVYHYIGLIDRCINISIGYSRQHSSAESLDLNYLMGLRDASLKVFAQS